MLNRVSVVVFSLAFLSLSLFLVKDTFGRHMDDPLGYCDAGWCWNANKNISTGPIGDTVVPSLYGESLTYGIDTAVSPCEDHFSFVNGGWRSVAVLPPRKQGGMRVETFFNHTYRTMLERIEKGLLSAQSNYATTDNPTVRALGTFFESCMVADSLEPDYFKRRKPDSTARDSTRTEKCVSRSLYYMGGASGQLFAQQLISTGAVHRMEKLLEALKVQVVKRIDENTIMSEVEKDYARDRLNKLILRVGIPEEMVDFSGLKLSPVDYHENKKTIGTFYNMQWVDGIGGNMRERWKASLLTPNAFYMPMDHAIEIPSVMFSPPFFYADGDDYLNFAGVGTVIGHEIFHSIAQQLPLIESHEMKSEIDSFKVFNTSMGTLDGWTANGERTFSEDVADLGGGRVAYAAWKSFSSYDTAKNSVVDGYTAEQRFFIAMGRVWRSKWIGGAPNHDVHAPYFARVNATVMQIPEFSTAFGCKPGDKMYVAPEKLSRIW